MSAFYLDVQAVEMRDYYDFLEIFVRRNIKVRVLVENPGKWEGHGKKHIHGHGHGHVLGST